MDTYLRNKVCINHHLSQYKTSYNSQKKRISIRESKGSIKTLYCFCILFFASACMNLKDRANKQNVIEKDHLPIPAGNNALATSIFISYLLPAQNKEQDFKKRLTVLLGKRECKIIERKKFISSINNINQLKNNKFNEILSKFKSYHDIGHRNKKEKEKKQEYCNKLNIKIHQYNTYDNTETIYNPLYNKKNPKKNHFMPLSTVRIVRDIPDNIELDNDSINASKTRRTNHYRVKLTDYKYYQDDLDNKTNILIESENERESISESDEKNNNDLSENNGLFKSFINYWSPEDAPKHLSDKNNSYVMRLEKLSEKNKWYEFRKKLKNKPKDLKISDTLIHRPGKTNILHIAAYNGSMNIIVSILEELKKEFIYSENKKSATNSIHKFLQIKNQHKKTVLELARMENIPLKPIDDICREITKYNPISEPKDRNKNKNKENKNNTNNLKGNEGITQYNQDKVINNIKKQDCDCRSSKNTLASHCKLKPPSGFKDGINLLLKCGFEECGILYWRFLGYGNFQIGSLVPTLLLCNLCKRDNIDEDSPTIEKIIICHANMDYHIKYIEKKQARSNSDKKLNHKVNHLQQLEIDFDSEYKYFEIKLRSLD